MSEGTRRALQQWVGEYVEVLVAAQVKDQARRRTGRIQAVGSDGLIFQPLSSPKQTENLPSQNFFPWHTVVWVDYVGE